MFNWRKKSKEPESAPKQVQTTKTESYQSEDPDSTGIEKLQNINVPTCLILTYIDDPDETESSTVEFVNSQLVPAIVLAALHGKRRLVKFAVYAEMVRGDNMNQAEYDLRRYVIPDSILDAMNSEEGSVKINSRGFIVKNES